MYNKQQNLKEVNEAIEAGNHALMCLEKAKDSLSGAKGFGIWDMLGGGMISGLLKHSRIEQASRDIEAAKCYLNRFRKELADIRMSQELSVEVDGFLTFADFIFDNILVDWMVQSKINKAYDDVVDAIANIRSILLRLDEMKCQEMW